MLPLPHGAVRQTFILAFLLYFVKEATSDKKVVCYYTNWSVYRPGTAKFNPQNINPYLCTHLIYAFGGFTKDNTLKAFDKYQDIEQGGYAKFTGLKTYNKNLKTLLAIGGWNEGSSRFSPLVANPERRQKFVKNILKFLRQNHFDGLDLDWEYPAHRDGGKSRDKENYALFVQELRTEFDRESSKTGRPRLLLTMAVPAGIEYIEKGYDIPKLNKYLDWFNILSYDFHSAFEPSVNHHAPLYPLAEDEDDEYNFDGELNIDYSVKHYLTAGADPEKIVLGIPTYGRSYTLTDEENTDIGAPAEGPGEQGDATREKGYLAYYEICQNIKKGNDWTVIQPNPRSMGPFAFNRNQWVGYDDEEIVKKKAEYVVSKGLGGIMFWSIDNDDFRGNCNGRPYPLIEAAKEAMFDKLGYNSNEVVRSDKNRKPGRSRSQNLSARNKISSTPIEKDKSESKTKRPTRKRVSSTTTTTTSTSRPTVSQGRSTTPEPPTTPDPGADFKCEDEGFFSHPRDCKKYYWCLDSGPSNLGIIAHQFTCPSGLHFNPAADSCDFARNVLCKTKTKQSTIKPVTEPYSTTKFTTTTTTSSPKNTEYSNYKNTLFRQRTTSTTPEPEYEEYEDEDENEDEDPQDKKLKTYTKDPEEDPKVIKELIDVIKKIGGIKELERLFPQTDDDNNDEIKETTIKSNLTNNPLYNKVLEKQKSSLITLKERFNTLNAFQRNTKSFETTERKKTNDDNEKYSSVLRNSRPSPQNEGIEKLAEFEGFLREKPKYVTLTRSHSSQNKTNTFSNSRNGGETDRHDEDNDDVDDEEIDDDDDDIENDEILDSEIINEKPPSSTLSYVNIRRTLPSTTISTLKTDIVTDIDSTTELNISNDIRTRSYQSIVKNRYTTTEKPSNGQEKINQNITEDINISNVTVINTENNELTHAPKRKLVTYSPTDHRKTSTLATQIVQPADQQETTIKPYTKHTNNKSIVSPINTNNIITTEFIPTTITQESISETISYTLNPTTTERIPLLSLTTTSKQTLDSTELPEQMIHLENNDMKKDEVTETTTNTPTDITIENNLRNILNEVNVNETNVTINNLTNNSDSNNVKILDKSSHRNTNLTHNNNGESSYTKTITNTTHKDENTTIFLGTISSPRPFSHTHKIIRKIRPKVDNSSNDLSILENCPPSGICDNNNSNKNNDVILNKVSFINPNSHINSNIRNTSNLVNSDTKIVDINNLSTVNRTRGRLNFTSNNKNKIKFIKKDKVDSSEDDNNYNHYNDTSELSTTATYNGKLSSSKSNTNENVSNQSSNTKIFSGNNRNKLNLAHTSRTVLSNEENSLNATFQKEKSQISSESLNVNTKRKSRIETLRTSQSRIRSTQRTRSQTTTNNENNSNIVTSTNPTVKKNCKKRIIERYSNDDEQNQGTETPSNVKSYSWRDPRMPKFKPWKTTTSSPFEFENSEKPIKVKFVYEDCSEEVTNSNSPSNDNNRNEENERNQEVKIRTEKTRTKLISINRPTSVNLNSSNSNRSRFKINETSKYSNSKRVEEINKNSEFLIKNNTQNNNDSNINNLEVEPDLPSLTTETILNNQQETNLTRKYTLRTKLNFNERRNITDDDQIKISTYDNSSASDTTAIQRNYSSRATNPPNRFVQRTKVIVNKKTNITDRITTLEESSLNENSKNNVSNFHRGTKLNDKTVNFTDQQKELEKETKKENTRPLFRKKIVSIHKDLDQTPDYSKPTLDVIELNNTTSSSSSSTTITGGNTEILQNIQNNLTRKYQPIVRRRPIKNQNSENLKTVNYKNNNNNDDDNDNDNSYVDEEDIIELNHDDKIKIENLEILNKSVETKYKKPNLRFKNISILKQINETSTQQQNFENVENNTKLALDKNSSESISDIFTQKPTRKYTFIKRKQLFSTTQSPSIQINTENEDEILTTTEISKSLDDNSQQNKSDPIVLDDLTSISPGNQNVSTENIQENIPIEKPTHRYTIIRRKQLFSTTQSPSVQINTENEDEILTTTEISKSLDDNSQQNKSDPIVLDDLTSISPGNQNESTENIQENIPIEKPTHKYTIIRRKQVSTTQNPSIEINTEIEDETVTTTETSKSLDDNSQQNISDSIVLDDLTSISPGNQNVSTESVTELNNKRRKIFKVVHFRNRTQNISSTNTTISNLNQSNNFIDQKSKVDDNEINAQNKTKTLRRRIIIRNKVRKNLTDTEDKNDNTLIEKNEDSINNEDEKTNLIDSTNSSSIKSFTVTENQIDSLNSRPKLLKRIFSVNREKVNNITSNSTLNETSTENITSIHDDRNNESSIPNTINRSRFRFTTKSKIRSGSSNSTESTTTSDVSTKSPSILNIIELNTTTSDSNTDASINNNIKRKYIPVARRRPIQNRIVESVENVKNKNNNNDDDDNNSDNDDDDDDDDDDNDENINSNDEDKIKIENPKILNKSVEIKYKKPKLKFNNTVILKKINETSKQQQTSEDTNNAKLDEDSQENRSDFSTERPTRKYTFIKRKQLVSTTQSPPIEIEINTESVDEVLTTTETSRSLIRNKYNSNLRGRVRLNLSDLTNKTVEEISTQKDNDTNINDDDKNNDNENTTINTISESNNISIDHSKIVISRNKNLNSRLQVIKKNNDDTNDNDDGDDGDDDDDDDDDSNEYDNVENNNNKGDEEETVNVADLNSSNQSLRTTNKSSTITEKKLNNSISRPQLQRKVFSIREKINSSSSQTDEKSNGFVPININRSRFKPTAKFKLNVTSSSNSGNTNTNVSEEKPIRKYSFIRRKPILTTQNSSYETTTNSEEEQITTTESTKTLVLNKSNTYSRVKINEETLQKDAENNLKDDDRKEDNETTIKPIFNRQYTVIDRLTTITTESSTIDNSNNNHQHNSDNEDENDGDDDDDDDDDGEDDDEYDDESDGDDNDDDDDGDNSDGIQINTINKTNDLQNKEIQNEIIQNKNSTKINQISNLTYSILHREKIKNDQNESDFNENTLSTKPTIYYSDSLKSLELNNLENVEQNNNNTNNKNSTNLQLLAQLCDNLKNSSSNCIESSNSSSNAFLDKKNSTNKTDILGNDVKNKIFLLNANRRFQNILNNSNSSDVKLNGDVDLSTKEINGRRIRVLKFKRPVQSNSIEDKLNLKSNSTQNIEINSVNQIENSVNTTTEIPLRKKVFIRKRPLTTTISKNTTNTNDTTGLNLKNIIENDTTTIQTTSTNQNRKYKIIKKIVPKHENLTDIDIEMNKENNSTQDTNLTKESFNTKTDTEESAKLLNNTILSSRRNNNLNRKLYRPTRPSVSLLTNKLEQNSNTSVLNSNENNSTYRRGYTNIRRGSTTQKPEVEESDKKKSNELNYKIITRTNAINRKVINGELSKIIPKENENIEINNDDAAENNDNNDDDEDDDDDYNDTDDEYDEDDDDDDEDEDDDNNEDNNKNINENETVDKSNTSQTNSLNKLNLNSYNSQSKTNLRNPPTNRKQNIPIGINKKLSTKIPSRFRLVRPTNNSKVQNRNFGTTSQIPIINQIGVTTKFSLTTPSVFKSTNTKLRKYTTVTSTTENTLKDDLLLDLNVNALNARNKKIFEITSKKHTTIKPKTIKEQLNITSENENNIILLNNVNTTTTTTTTTQTSEIISDKNDTNVKSYLNNDLNNFQETTLENSINGPVTTTEQHQPSTTTTEKATTFSHIFSVNDDLNKISTTEISDIENDMITTIENEEKLVEINRVVEVSSKENKLKLKSIGIDLDNIKTSSHIKLIEPPHIDKLGEISRVKYVTLVESGEDDAVTKSYNEIYTDNILNENRKRGRQLILPEVIRGIETSTIPLEGLFKTYRKSKSNNNNIEYNSSPVYAMSLGEAYVTTIPNIAENENDILLDNDEENNNEQNENIKDTETTVPPILDATTTALPDRLTNYVRPIVPLLRPESNESSPLVISIANLDKPKINFRQSLRPLFNSRNELSTKLTTVNDVESTTPIVPVTHSGNYNKRFKNNYHTTTTTEKSSGTSTEVNRNTRTTQKISPLNRRNFLRSTTRNSGNNRIKTTTVSVKDLPESSTTSKPIRNRFIKRKYFSTTAKATTVQVPSTARLLRTNNDQRVTIKESDQEAGSSTQEKKILNQKINNFNIDDDYEKEKNEKLVEAIKTISQAPIPVSVSIESTLKPNLYNSDKSNDNDDINTSTHLPGRNTINQHLPIKQVLFRTTIKPKTTELLSIIPNKTKKPFEKVNSRRKFSSQNIYRLNIDDNYYDDDNNDNDNNDNLKNVGKSNSQVKVILHERGFIECLDQGNFPHPLSCRKFVSCAKMETGGVVGWEYTCPKNLSYDPVGGICNWAAGTGCKD